MTKSRTIKMMLERKLVKQNSNKIKKDREKESYFPVPFVKSIRKIKKTTLKRKSMIQTIAASKPNAQRNARYPKGIADAGLAAKG